MHCTNPVKRKIEVTIAKFNVVNCGHEEIYVDFMLKVNGNLELKFSHPYGVNLYGKIYLADKNKYLPYLITTLDKNKLFGYFDTTKVKKENNYQELRIFGYENYSAFKNVTENIFANSDTVWLAQTKMEKQGTIVIEKWPIINQVVIVKDTCNSLIEHKKSMQTFKEKQPSVERNLRID